MNNPFTLRSYVKSKDYVKSPFRYPGGKFYAVKYILPFLNCVPHDEYREPFVGGGSIFFAKPKAKFNVINDVDCDIIDMYRAFSDEVVSESIIELLNTEIVTKERHTYIKEMNPQGFMEKVFKTYYLNRTSYCGIINKPAWGYKEGKSSPPQNWGAFIRAIRNKMKGIEITNNDFESVVNKDSEGKKALIYLDPPYYAADQKRAYAKSFSIEDHMRLAAVLKDTEYYFCLSYDDVPEIRSLYNWANIYEQKWLYCTANKKGEKRDLGNELIITNYDVIAPNEMLLNFEESSHI